LAIRLRVLRLGLGLLSGLGLILAAAIFRREKRERKQKQLSLSLPRINGVAFFFPRSANDKFAVHQRLRFEQGTRNPRMALLKKAHSNLGSEWRDDPATFAARKFFTKQFQHAPFFAAFFSKE
jgi:transcriptional regulator with XRE-family HTH domain